MARKTITRRTFLVRSTALTLGLGATAALLEACTPTTPPTAPVPASNPAAAPPAAPAAPAPAPTSMAVPPPTSAPAAAPAGRPAVLPPDAAPPDKQVLTVMGREGKYLDWSKSVWQRQFEPALVSEPMVRRDQNYELKPAAAERWEIASDGLTWTFHLRSGLKWSDGTPLTAQDYVFTARRVAEPNTGFEVAWYYAPIKGFKAANEGKAPLEEIGVKALDERTVAITTEQPTPFLGLLAADLPPVPQHVVEKVGDNWSLDPTTCLACGPYKLEAWDKGRQLVFSANSDYNGPWKPLLQKIVYKIGDDAALFPAYENGEIDLIERGYEQVLSPADQTRVESDPKLSQELHKWPQFQTWWISFGGDNTVFKDAKVRQAFSHAIDRDALINSALKGQAVPAWGLLPPGFHASNQDNVKGIQSFDVAKAKQLLADAGFPDGKGFPQYELFLREPSPTVKNVGQAIQAMIKQNLGIELGLQSYERKTFMDRLNKYELPILLISWDMDYYDASNFMDVFKSGGRHPWKNDDYDRLVKQADGLVGDEAKRAQLYQQAEKILVQDAGGVFLWHPIFTQLWKPYLRGDCLSQNRYGILGWQAPEKGPQYYCAYVTNDKR